MRSVSYLKSITKEIVYGDILKLTFAAFLSTYKDVVTKLRHKVIKETGTYTNAQKHKQ